MKGFPVLEGKKKLEIDEVDPEVTKASKLFTKLLMTYKKVYDQGYISSSDNKFLMGFNKEISKAWKMTPELSGSYKKVLSIYSSAVSKGEKDQDLDGDGKKAVGDLKSLLKTA